MKPNYGNYGNTPNYGNTANYGHGAHGSPYKRAGNATVETLFGLPEQGLMSVRKFCELRHAPYEEVAAALKSKPITLYSVYGEPDDLYVPTWVFGAQVMLDCAQWLMDAQDASEGL